MAAKKPAKPKKPTAAHDATSDASLLALDPSYAAAPDMPVAVAQREIASLARLGQAQHIKLAKVGISAVVLADLAHFAKRLSALETAWRKARTGVALTAAQRKLREEAEALDSKLLAGGRWACRKDQTAQTELSRIAEGSGLADTVQDLRDLVTFWDEHADVLGHTDITAKDLTRAAHLAGALEEAAANEASDADAARALELRNRCFWAADGLAKEVREGGRYAFRAEPKLAAKFVSRYRAAVDRRARRKAKAAKKTAKQPPAKGGTE